MTFKKKFKRFRKEWFYTGSLAFLTACLIMLILFTSFIISNAEGNSIISEDDLIIVSDIESWFNDNDLDFSDYSSCVGNGYTSSLEDSVYTGSYGDIISYLSDSNLSCSYNTYDFEEQEIDYNIIEDVVFSSSDLASAPYVVQVSNGGTYMYKFFFKPKFDGSGTFAGFNDLGGLKIFRNYIFVPENTCILDVYISDNDSVSSAGLHSASVGVSGYYSYLYDGNDDPYQVLTYDRLPSSYSTIATNIDTVALKTDDIENDYNLSNNADLFSDSDMTSTMKLFYTTVGLDVDGVYKIYIKPLGKNDSTVYPDGSGGDDSNNLVLNQSDWKFKNSQYSAPYSNVIDTGSVIPNGSCTFSAVLNDYQIDNSSNFEIVYGFTFDLDVNYQNWGSSDFGPFKQTSKLLNNKKNYKGYFTYIFTDSSTLTQSLQDFYSNGSSKSFTFNELFNGLHGTSGGLVSILNQMKELDTVEYNKFNITCTAFLDSHNTTSSSGKCSEWYNPMNKKGYTLDKSSQENPNPYIPSDDEQGNEDVKPKPQTPGPGGNDPNQNDDNNNDDDDDTVTTSSGSGNVNVTVTNKPTFNNNVTGGSSNGSDLTNPENSSIFNFWNIFNPVNLFFGQLIKGKDASVETISNATHSNGWIQLMGEIFSFIPASFWSAMGTFFVACLGIIVIAFVIRIILDLL